MGIARPPMVIGVGSHLGQDDGVGLLLVEHLIEAFSLPEEDAVLMEDADVADIASTLLEYERSVLLVDCADMGETPGTHRFFDEKGSLLNLRSDSASTHGFGFSDGLALAKALGYRQDVHVFAIQPFDLSPKQGLTPELQERFSELFIQLRTVYLSFV